MGFAKRVHAYYTCYSSKIFVEVDCFLVHESHNTTIMINRTSDTDCSRQYTSKEVTSNNNSVRDENVIFQSLKPTELLKHLLNHTDEKSFEFNNKDCDVSDTCKRTDGAKNESLLPQTKNSNVSSVIQCNQQKISPMPLPVSQNITINKLPTREENSPYEFFEEAIASPQYINNGIMEDNENTSNTKYREDLQRYLSDESSIEEEIKSLSNEILSYKAMDFILNEAERALHIQSSPSSQGSDCELTELLPLKLSSDNNTTPLTPITFPSPTTSQTGSSYSPKSAIPTDNVNCDINTIISKETTISDDDQNNVSNLDEDMVLVPAGKFN